MNIVGKLPGNTVLVLKEPKPTLNQDQQKEAIIKQLQQRDTEVRSHENQHIRQAGGLATGLPTYQYTIGPDGKRYATGGQVQISYGNPKQAKQALLAALAPGSPSIQDQMTANDALRISNKTKQNSSAPYFETPQYLDKYKKNQEYINNQSNAIFSPSNESSEYQSLDLFG